MEMQWNEEINEIMGVIDDLTVEFKELLVGHPLVEQLNYVIDELNKAFFILLRTAVLQSKKPECSDNDKEYNLDAETKHYRSDEFRNWIEEDEGRKTKMDMYNLLMDGDQEDPRVQAAFLKVENSLKEFFKLNDEDKFSTRDQYIKDRKNLKLSVYNLMNACIKTSTDEDYCKAVLGRLGVKTIYATLCKDLMEERLRGKRVERMFIRHLFK